MKRLLLMVLLLVIAGAAIADDAYIHDLDGFDWMRMTRDEKSWFILGYWTALITLQSTSAMTLDEHSASYDRMIGELTEFFDVPGTVDDWVDQVDREYQTYTEREWNLYLIVGYVVHPEWFMP